MVVTLTLERPDACSMIITHASIFKSCKHNIHTMNKVILWEKCASTLRSSTGLSPTKGRGETLTIINTEYPSDYINKYGWYIQHAIQFNPFCHAIRFNPSTDQKSWKKTGQKLKEPYTHNEKIIKEETGEESHRGCVTSWSWSICNIKWDIIYYIIFQSILEAQKF